MPLTPQTADDPCRSAEASSVEQGCMRNDLGVPDSVLDDVSWSRSRFCEARKHYVMSQSRNVRGDLCGRKFRASSRVPWRLGVDDKHFHICTIAAH